MKFKNINKSNNNITVFIEAFFKLDIFETVAFINMTAIWYF